MLHANVMLHALKLSGTAAVGAPKQSKPQFALAARGAARRDPMGQYEDAGLPLGALGAGGLWRRWSKPRLFWQLFAKSPGRERQQDF